MNLFLCRRPVRFILLAKHANGKEVMANTKKFAESLLAMAYDTNDAIADEVDLYEKQEEKLVEMLEALNRMPEYTSDLKYHLHALCLAVVHELTQVGEKLGPARKRWEEAQEEIRKLEQELTE
jgi:cell division protein ZapA (FtsZ GTPase activity inhibitor)